jgi:hypothetical protein
MNKKSRTKNELCSLMNVGPATLKDLVLLGITTRAQLAKANPNELYSRLQEITGHRHDPCVWDVFAAIIHEANTGEKTPWWHWTPIRKAGGYKSRRKKSNKS